MVARTLLFKWALLAPAATALCVIVQHQMLEDQFNPIAVDVRVDNRIDPYVPLVKEIEIANFNNYPDLERAKLITSKWRIASTLNQLQPLVPCYYGDEYEEGPRSQVVAAAMCLVNELARGAISATQSYRYKEALQYIDDAVNVLEDLKYSDIAILGRVLNKQRRLVSTLRWINSQSGDSYTDRVSEIHTKFGVVPEKLEKLGRHFRSQYLQYSQRYIGVDKTLVSDKSVSTFFFAILRVANSKATKDDQMLLGRRESFYGMPEFLIKMHLSVTDSHHQLMRDLQLDPIACGPGIYPNLVANRKIRVSESVSEKYRQIWAIKKPTMFPFSQNRPLSSYSSFNQGRLFDSAAAHSFLNP